MDESDNSAGPSTQVIQGDEVDVEWLQLVKASHDAALRVSQPVDLSSLPAQSSLLAISNTWGLLFAGSANDIQIHRLSDLHGRLEASQRDDGVEKPIQTIPLAGAPVFVRLAHQDEVLTVTLANGGGMLVWRTRDVLQGKTNPYHTFSQIPAAVLDVLPNPAASSDPLSNLIAVVTPEGVAIADTESCQIAWSIPGSFTCGSWSAKGKQIVLGGPDGALAQYTPDSTRKAEIPKPPSLEQAFSVAGVQWLEKDLFFASYAGQDAAPDDPLEVFIISRTQTGVTYVQFYDPLNTMGNSARGTAFRHFASLRSWGSEIRHLAFIMSGSATEVGVLRGNGDKWESLILDETARAIMPMRKRGATEDPSCIGLALDLTSDKLIKRGIVGGIEQPDLPAAPRLLLYTQDGTVISYNVLNPDAGAYPEMVRPQDILSTSTPAAAASSPAPPSTEPPKAVSGFGAFSNPTSSPSAFGASGFGSTTSGTPSAFGGSGFAKPASPSPAPAFGQTTTSSAFGQSAFGGAPKPAFGASSFGQPAFGQSQTPSSGKPAFGASAFGGSSTTPVGGFGAFAKPTGFSFGGMTTSPSATQDIKPAAPFGGAGAGGAFGGSSAFGGGSAFGSSAFGKPSFGQPAAAALGGSGEPKPAFAGFGATSKAPAPATSGFAGFGTQGAKPAAPPPSSSGSGDDFGLGGFASALQTNTSSAVPGLEDSPPPSPSSKAGRVPGLEDDSPPSTPSLQPAAPKPAAPPTSGSGGFIKPATGGFGAFSSTPSSTPAKSPSAFSSASAFGGSPSTTPASTPAPTTASPAFGKPSAIGGSTPAFGASAFGKSSPLGGGGGSAFGAGAFGASSKPATGAFGATAPSTNISGGFGAFASSPSGSGGTTGGFAGFGKPAATGSAFGTVKSSTSGFGALLSGKLESQKPTPAPSVPAAEIKEPEKDITPPPAPSVGSAANHETSPTATDAKDPSGEVQGYEVPSSSPAQSPEKSAPLPTSSTESSSHETDSPTPAAAQVEEPPSPPEDLGSTAGSLQVVDADDDSDADYDEVEAAEGEGDESVLTEEGEGVEGEAEEAVGDEAAEEDEDEEDYEDDEGEYEEEDEDASGEEDGEESGEHLPPIEEAAEEDAPDSPESPAVDAKADTSAVSSSPTWFGTYKPDPIPTSSTEPAPPGPLSPTPISSKSEGSSLLSRLGAPPTAPAAPDAPASVPVAAAKQAPPVFNLKHAARTSSPLGTQPPQNADTRSPENTPPKSTAAAVSGGFSLFNPPQSTASPPPASGTAAPPAPVPAKSGFSFGTSSSANKASELSAAPPSLFGTSPSSSTSATSSFAPPSVGPEKKTATASFFAPPAVQSPSTASAAPSLFAPKPPGSAPAVANEKSPFGTSLGLGRPSASPAPQAPSAAAPTSAPTAPAPTTFSLPTRPAPVPPPARKEGGDSSMAGVLERMITELSSEMKALRASLDASGKYHAALNASFATLTPEVLTKNKAIPLSSASEIAGLADQASREVASLRKQDVRAQAKLGEIQSKMIKTDLKLAHFQRLAGMPSNLTTDPTDKSVTEGLGPAQMISQTRMRQTLQSVESNLDKLELAVSNLKRGGSGSRRQSSIAGGGGEWDYQTALQGRVDALEELSVRIGRMGLATPGTPARPHEGKAGSASPWAARPNDLHTPPEIASAARTAARSAVDNSERLKLRLKGLKTRQTIVPAPPLSTSRSEDPGRGVAPQDSTHHTHPADTPGPSSSFAGLTFSLDPNAGSTGVSPPSRNRGSGISGGSSRQHAPAAKFQPSSAPAPVPTAGATGGTGGTGGFSFGWPRGSALAGEKDRKATPAGFVGFGNFAQK